MSGESKELMLNLYRTMVRIRMFEETGAELVRAGKIHGTLHLYSGEEAIASGVCSCLTDKDCITSTHRGHGHCIAKGADTKKMMAEIFGKATGYSKGKGGSMHIADVSKGVMGANGIVGAGLPIAVGVAFAQKYREESNVTVAFFGDGATNRGTFHEAVNLAACLCLPVVFVCENNNFGMSTPFSYASHNETVAQRGKAYDIPGIRVDGNDPIAVREAAMEAIGRARRGEGPSIIECMTWRHHGHFLGDPGLYKTPEDEKYWRENDPIPRFERRLLEESIASEGEVEAIRREARAEIDDAVRFAQESPYPPYEEIFEDLFV